jgi:hypothetical protein
VIRVLLLLLCVQPVASMAGLASQQAFRATYLLLFNGELVGHAYLKLSVEADDRYRFEIFTLPAGRMDAEERHEILESSRGTLGAVSVRPERYDYSMRTSMATALFAQKFDWQAGKLLIRSDSEQTEVALEPGSQDRISYILLARQMAAQKDAAALELAVVGLEATLKTELKPLPPRTVDTGIGPLEAVGIERSTAEQKYLRKLWFAPARDYVPVLIEQSWEKGEVRMVLETLGR